MRLDDLPENELDRTLGELELLSAELKNKQFVGTDNVRFYQSNSTATYDWSGLLPASPSAPATGTKILQVTATANAMDNLFADLIVELYVSASLYTPADYLVAKKASLAAFNYTISNGTVNVANRKQRQWYVVINGDKTTTVGAKLYVVGSDAATLSVVEVN